MTTEDDVTEVMRLKALADKIDTMAKPIHTVVAEKVDELTDRLDTIVQDIMELLDEGSITTAELENNCMLLSAELYYVSVNRENLFVKFKLAEQQKKTIYAQAFSGTEGTVGQKQSIAVMTAQNESLVEIMFASAFNKVDQRVKTATDLLNSMKKMLGSRSTRG